MGIVTLEDLAQSSDRVDVKEFGLKTEGLIELIRSQPLFRHPGNEFLDFDFVVPPGFVVSTFA